MWVHAPECSILIKFAGSTVLVQSYYFIYQMVFILKTKLNQQRMRKEARIHQWWFSENPQLYELGYLKRKDASEKIM